MKIMLTAVLAVAILCLIASYLFTPTTDDIPYTVLDDPSIESHITKSYLDNGNLIINIYNPNCEIVRVKPATIEYHVSADMDSVKIFNYTNQSFGLIIGNSSDVYLFAWDTKKDYDKINKTITILNDTTKSTLMTVRLVSSVPDITTFTEVFEVTNFELYTPDKDVDLKSRSELHKGSNGVYKTEWFVEKNISYIINVTDYKVIQVEEEIYNNKTGKNETVLVNKTVVSGYHNETHYKDVWVDYDLYDTQLSKNTVQKIKTIYHKKPELGVVQIKTVPIFMGVECDELTWWNTSWNKRIQRNVKNSSVALTDYQIKNTTTYDSDMQADFDDLRFTNDTGTLIPYWIESKTDSSTADIWLKVPSISTTTGATVWMYYNNSAASSASSGADTFIQWHGSATAGYIDSLVEQAPMVVEGRMTFTSTSETHNMMGASTTSAGTTESVSVNQNTGYSGTRVSTKNDGSSTGYNIGGGVSLDSIYKMILDGTNASFYKDGIFEHTLTTTVPAGDDMGLFFIRNDADCTHVWSFIRKYTATEPTWGTDGAEEDAFSIVSYAPSTPLNKLEGELQYFNVTTDENCQCRWYINGSLKQTNTTQQTDHNYTNTSLELGYYNFSAVVNTSSGATDMQTWWVTVTDPPFIPPNPTNLTNTTGNFWIRHAWDVGAGNITDECAVNVNGSWYNTSNTFINLSKPAHGHQNITVQAWNSSGVGTLSAGTLSDNVSLSNNPVALTNYSLVYSIQEFDTITIDFDYTDADGDTVTFATDAVNGTQDSGTGVYSWTTTWMDRSVNHWTFNVSDGYGSVDSVVVEIEVTAYPITDLDENWQYHESDDPSDTWDVYAAGNGHQTGWGSSQGDQTVSTTITGTLTKSLKLYAYAWCSGGPITSYCTAHATIQSPTLSDYLSFVIRDVTYTTVYSNAAHTKEFKIYLYDIEGYLINSYDITSYANADHSNDLFELTRLSDNLYLRVSGDNKGIIGTCNEQPSFIRFFCYAKVVDTNSCQGYWDYTTLSVTIDDITTGTAINGIGVSHSDAPAYANTHTWADSELWTVPPTITTTYALKTTPIADYTAAEYTMKVQHILTSEYVNTTIIKPVGEAPNSTQKPCGTVSLSQPTLFGDNYGMYNFIIDKDGTTVATDYIYWMNMDISGDSYVVVDLPTYPAGAQISPSYFIDNINLLEYKYYIKTLSLFGTQMDISSDLLVDTGTVDVDTTGYDVTSYWCILVRESRADGSAVEMASDLFAITNTITLEGIVYNAESGSPLGDSKVALYQNGLWYNTTTNSTTGEYNLSDLTTDIDITVYAEHTGYTHESFTFTPLVAGIISLDIYMIPDTPSYTGTAIGGLALYAPYYQALNGATVNLWNSSWSDDTASSATGYYLFDNIVNGSFTGNATMLGYSTATNEDIVTASGDYTQQNYLLQPQNILTVKAKDVSTHATLMTFSVVFDEGVTYETTDGFVNITTGIGIYKVEVSADGYYVGIDYATVVSDTEITLYLVPIEESGEGIYYPSHYVSFIVQSITGTLYANVTTSVYNAANSSSTALFSDVTGSDGVVGFELNETTLYRITFVDVAQGIDEEFTLYPIDTEYIVIVSSSISFVTETPDTNLTNTTIQYTNQSWSIQNLTGDYLSTTLGISHTGQGVIAATICWATCTVACGVPTIAVLAILAQLGVVSWIMVLFTGMTMLSIYILGGKIG